MHAIVLARRDFREYDQIISLYTLERGKLDLVARGVKKIVSKNAGNLEPGSYVDIGIAEGRELDYVTNVQPIEIYARLRSNMETLLLVRYICELTDRFIHSTGERDTRIFEMTRSWLSFVNEAERVRVLLAYGYMATMLGCLGFLPVIEQCVVCGVGAGLVNFSFFYGGALCARCSGVAVQGGSTQEDGIFAVDNNVLICLCVMVSGDWGRINELHPEDKNIAKISEIIRGFSEFCLERYVPHLTNITTMVV